MPQGRQPLPHMEDALSGVALHWRSLVGTFSQACIIEQEPPPQVHASVLEQFLWHTIADKKKLNSAMTFHSGSGMKPRRATGRRRSMMMWWSWLFIPMNLFLLKLTVLLKLAANPSENFTSLNHLRMVILSSLLTQYFALSFFHTPLEFLFRCSFGRSQY